MELILICAKIRRFRFLCRKLLKHSLKEMLSKEPENLRFLSLTTEAVSPINAFIVSDFRVALCITFSTGKAF